jgi:hypothetical protein
MEMIYFWLLNGLNPNMACTKQSTHQKAPHMHLATKAAHAYARAIGGVKKPKVLQSQYTH